MGYTPREVTSHEVLQFIKSKGATWMVEIKNHFNVDSASIRRPLGLLYASNRVICIGGHAGRVWWMRRTGKRGRPNPWQARKEAQS